MDQAVSFSRVFLSNPGLYRHYQCADWQLWVYDRTSIPYLIEEFVAHAAIEILLPANSIAGRSISELSSVLKDRITIIDQDSNILRTVGDVLRPIYKEFNLEAAGPYYYPRRIERDSEICSFETLAAITALREEMYDFLVGSHFVAQVGLDFDRLASAVAQLRTVAQNPDARACLSVIAGVINTYQKVSVPSVSLIPATTEEQVYRFRVFVEDQVCRALSKDTMLLAIPGKLKHALRLMTRRVHELMRQPLLQGLFKMGSSGVEAATGLSIPDGEALNKLVPKGYFPPILSFSELNIRAQTIWQSQPLDLNVAFDALDLKQKDREVFLAVEAHKHERWKPVQKPLQPRHNMKGVTVILSASPK